MIRALSVPRTTDQDLEFANITPQARETQSPAPKNEWLKRVGIVFGFVQLPCHNSRHNT